MAKFKISLKLQSLEVNIEGEREDIPAISRALSQQLTGLIAPSVATASSSHDGDDSTQTAVPRQAVELVEEVKRKSAKKRAPSKRSVPSSESVESVVDWRHDPIKYGNPSQAWSTANKALWLLYVVGEAADVKELAAKRIADTFNKHFRQSKTITVFNVSRDLGKLKGKAPAAVGEDTTKDPSNWYLTTEGIRVAQGFVAEALGRKE